MPLRVSSDLTAAGTRSPVVSTDLVILLPDEIVAVSADAERTADQVLVCCRTVEQASTLSDRLLEASVGSAVLGDHVGLDELAATLDAFRLGDFTVLLVSDGHPHLFQVGPHVHLLHADLPAPHGGIQLMSTLNRRRERVADQTDLPRTIHPAQQSA